MEERNKGKERKKCREKEKKDKQRDEKVIKTNKIYYGLHFHI